MVNIDILLKSQIGYIRQFVRSPRTFGTLTPSSPWLCQAMLSQVSWQKITRVAELGSGDGVLTRRILTAMPKDASLDAYEITLDLAQSLSKIQDPRLNVIARSAEILEKRYDLIFSCLPLLSLHQRTRLRILKSAAGQLNPGGTFIQFQYTSAAEKVLSRYFSWDKKLEIRNIPPAWVYYCKPERCFYA
ncbi:class I SAM-dependent methyltransferase [Martelella alba]|uniref:Methyltransferase n=1 Tax=Martelella alba TaxID=2590451 RepID=A0ABY2SRM1_9HYPH|nr:methyltransferase [Martelella alba]TKI08865.1 methyltransferase [Martelella alba]